MTLMGFMLTRTGALSRPTLKEQLKDKNTPDPYPPHHSPWIIFKKELLCLDSFPGVSISSLLLPCDSRAQIKFYLPFLLQNVFTSPFICDTLSALFGHRNERQRIPGQKRVLIATQSNVLLL